MLLFAPHAVAAFANYNSVLIGERAAGMAGAFSALSKDPAATPFYNPATTALLDGSSLSATVNVYNKFDTNIGETNDASTAPLRINRGFFRSLPASSGTIVKFNSFAIGLSILVPDYDSYSGQIESTEHVNSSLNFVDESLWVGGTMAAKLTPRDRIGLTVYYTARNLSRTASDRITTTDNTAATITLEEKNLTSNAIVPILGYHRALSPSWSFGVSYRAPSLPIAGEASYLKSVTTTSPYSTTLVNYGKLRAVTKIPAKLTLGVAREVPNKNTLSIDVQIYEGLNYQDLPEADVGSDYTEHQQITNLAVGYEQYLRDWLTVRFGYFTNLSSYSAPRSDRSQRQGDHIDMNGFSANFNIQTQKQTSFTFGGYYNGGSGTTTQIVNQNLVVLPKSQQVFTMLVATSFNF